ncbi:hypothetical protein [Hydrogenibacillus sp. N12]|uniref:hypothetical protein n=1 Tax=Hydrogenibacillus sp. N12 TaxID=2866627 RepID=UPI001C7CFD57|nr:hypothetical protein [Hydrogenibacillus sp. N12]QZA33809.1 hypothetical protein K2M58_04665 [Hydrogenibacillus sp. N12]
MKNSLILKENRTHGSNSFNQSKQTSVIARRALGFKEKVPKALIQKLLERPPGEGWTHWKLWGKRFGMFKATRKEISRYFNTSAFIPSDWPEHVFAGAG